MKQNKFDGASFAPFSRCTHVPVPPYSTVQVVYTTEQVEVNGSLVNQLVEKTVDRALEESARKVSDFSLENQIAVGSVGLNQYRTAGADVLENSEDRISAANNALDAALKAAQSNSPSNE